MRLYQGAALLTSASAEMIPRGGVLVDGPVIVAAGPLESLAPLAGPAEVVDLGGLTLMPGLVDVHVHLGFDGGPDPVARMKAETDAEQLVLMLHSARALLRAGITTARDLGARGFLDVVVRDAIAHGLADGPRLVTAARPLTPTGGHCWFMGGECDNADELRRMVRLHHKMGADLIKVMSTGGFMTTGSAPWYAQFTAAELTAIVAEAHRLGKRVAAHAHGAEGIARAVAARVDSIEHCSFSGLDGKYGAAFDPAVADEMAAQGIYAGPTMNIRTLQMHAQVGAARAKVITGLYSRGVQIISGTDAGIRNCPHDAFASGLEALVLAGLPVRETLVAATERAARALGLDDRTGTLEPGKDADLIAVRGDPLADIAVLHNVELVVARGREYFLGEHPDWLATASPGAAAGDLAGRGAA
jgi:imidazolonepropionase-like amidohydrolase